MADSPRILVLRVWDPHHPQPRSGAQQRLACIEEGLARLGQVTTVQLPWWNSVQLPGWRVNSKEVDPAGIHAALRWNLASHPGARPDAVQMVRELQPQTYDVVYVHRLRAAWTSGYTDPKRTIIDIDDVPSQHFAQRAEHGNPAWRLIKRLRQQRLAFTERRALNHFRFSLVCSDMDRQYLDHPRVRTAPNVYQPHPLMQGAADVPDDGSLLFVGALFYPPNVEAITWYVREVWPRVRARCPQATLRIIGRLPKEEAEVRTVTAPLQAPGVEVLGGVPDVGPYILKARAGICPILHGGGTRIKILESLAFSRPIISTSLGAYGHPMDQTQGLWRRDGVNDFADACVHWLQHGDEARAAAARGCQYVSDRFSPQALWRVLEELVGTILKEQGRAPRPASALVGA